MRFLSSVAPSLLLLAAGSAQAAASWGFDAASVSVAAKKSDDAAVHKFSAESPVSGPLSLGSKDTLKVTLTAQEKGQGKKPHQAFLVLQEPSTGLEAPFPLTVKESGKAKVEIKYSELPVQLATSSSPLQASIVLASFGSSEGLIAPIFEVEIVSEPGASPTPYEKPMRYGKREEIHHIFRDDPKSPPKIVSIVFALAVVAAMPLVCVAWLIHGGNLSHLPKAMSVAPVSHAIFFGSLIAMEGVFYLYYSSWNLFQTLPVAGVVGVATFLSGTKALGEVQGRRLAGEREG